MARDVVIGEHRLEELLGTQEREAIAALEHAVEELVLEIETVELGAERGGQEARRHGDRIAAHELEAADLEHLVARPEPQQPLQVGRRTPALDAEQPRFRVVRERRAAAVVPVRPEHAALELRLGNERAAPLAADDQPLALEVVERTAQRSAAHAEVRAEPGLRGQLVVRPPAPRVDLLRERFGDLVVERRELLRLEGGEALETRIGPRRRAAQRRSPRRPRVRRRTSLLGANLFRHLNVW